MRQVVRSSSRRRARTARLAPWALVGGAVLALAALPQAAFGAWSGRNGVIVFYAFTASCTPLPGGPVLAPSAGSLCDGVWSVRADGSGLRAVAVDGRNAFDPAVSADGRRVGLWTGPGLVITGIGGGSRRAAGAPFDPAHPRDLAAAQNIAFAPDGRIVVSDRTEGLGPDIGNCPSEEDVLRIGRIGAPAALLHTGTPHALAASFSSDGRWVAYDGFTKLSMKFVDIPNAGGCVPVHRDAIWIQRTGHPRTARKLASFTRQRGVDTIGGSIRPDISPDGRQVAVAADDGVLIVGVDGHGRHRLPGTSQAAGVAWSPDGRWLAVSERAAQGPGTTSIMLYPSHGGAPHTAASWPVGACGDCGIGTLAWQALPHAKR
jgi:hypothetical protein